MERPLVWGWWNFSKCKRRQFLTLLTRHKLQPRWNYSSSNIGLKICHRKSKHLKNLVLVAVGEILGKHWKSPKNGFDFLSLLLTGSPPFQILRNISLWKGFPRQAISISISIAWLHSFAFIADEWSEAMPLEGVTWRSGSSNSAKNHSVP